MKILFVLDTFDTNNNGTSISAQRFAAELRRRGHEVRVLCADADKADNKYIVSPLHIPVFQPLIDKQGMRMASYHGKKNKAVIESAVDWADIIHYYMPFWLSRYVCKVAEKKHKPQTAAFHIQPENLFSSVHLGKSKFFIDNTYRYFYHTFYKHFMHIHVPSDMMRKLLEKFHYQSKIHVISNGILDDFLIEGERLQREGRPPKSSEYQGKILIMMIGRLSVEKRQDVIINAVPYSRYAGKIQLVFAGNGPLRDEYIELGKKLKNKPQFVYKSTPELIALLSEADLYVHASDMESEAISCIEAFALGLVPVIANSDVSATPQFALDGRSLFLPGNPRDLARAIDYWLDHPQEKALMLAEYTEAAKHYSLAQSVTQFEQMLDEEMVNSRY